MFINITTQEQFIFHDGYWRPFVETPSTPKQVLSEPSTPKEEKAEPNKKPAPKKKTTKKSTKKEEK